MAQSMHRPTSPISERAAARRRLLDALGTALAVVLVLTGGALTAHWYFSTRSLAWQVRRGLDLLAGADTLQRARAALDRWENETRPAWDSRTEDLITHLYSDYPLDDQRVRLLLTRVAGADYGDRRADWKHWYDSRRRLRAGSQPEILHGDKSVRLEPRWTAPIGLTAWFSTIIPLDGQIYVASLGENFDDTQDAADGVVRVDGATGQSELIFSPPDRPGRGPRDVVGVAAGEDCLFVACLNGTVHCITAGGEPRWEAHVGSPIAGPPLAVDFNDDHVTDVIVATSAGRVVALSGQSGRTAWVETVAQPPPGTSLLGATLALGDVLPGQGPELVVTLPTGSVEVLAVRNGRSRWRHDFADGTVAGAVSRGGNRELGLPAYLGDRAARVWTLTSSGQSLQAVIWAALSLHREETLIAGLRTLREEPEGPPLLLACPTGGYGGNRAGVCAIGPEGVQWRLPVDGALWATPAVADLNGDRAQEIVAVSVQPRSDGRLVGVVTIVSQAGHVLHQLALTAAIECSPVVADVDGDGCLEVLIADQSGLLHCFGTGRQGPVRWGSFGGDSHNTRNADNAFSFGQVPFKYQWHWQPE